MKKNIFIIIAMTAFIATSCKLGSLTYYDDIYTTSSDQQYQKVSKETQAVTYSEEAPQYQSYESNNGYYDYEADANNNYNNNVNYLVQLCKDKVERQLEMEVKVKQIKIS